MLDPIAGGRLRYRRNVGRWMMLPVEFGTLDVLDVVRSVIWNPLGS